MSKLNFSIIFFLTVLCLVVFSNVNSANVKVCTRSGCKPTADLFNAVMDRTVNPCDNFYKYACGNFGNYTKDKHQNDERYSWTTLLTKNITAEIKKFISSNDTGKSELGAAKKAKNFQKLCTDTDLMDDKGLEPIRQLLAKVGLPTSFPLKKPTDFNWLATAAKIKRYLGVDFLFTLDVTNRKTNSSGQSPATITLGRPKKPLPFLDKGDSYSAKALDTAKLQTYAKAVFEQLSEKVNQPKSKAERMIIDKSVKSLVEFSTSRKELARRDHSKGANKYRNREKSIEDLQRFTDIVTECANGKKNESTVVWKDYFSSLLADIKDLEVKFVKNEIVFRYNEGGKQKKFTMDKIVVEDGVYLKKVITYVTSKRKEDLQLAMWFDVVTAYIQLTTYTMRHLEQDFIKQDYSAETWANECYKTVEKYFSMAVLQHVVSQKESLETKAEVQEFFDDYKHALGYSIEKADWIDNITKSAALEKVKKMKAKISHPDWLLDDAVLDKLYGEVEIITDDFFGTVVKWQQNSVTKKLLTLVGIGLKEPEEFDDEDFSQILEVNAFYSPADNVVTIPWGILRIPNYGYPLRALNYGAIGATVGHEITHGFDNDGIMYDAEGDETNWWQAEALENYQKRAQCFIDSYSSLEIDGVSFDGEQGLGENIADNGGLRESLLAYRHWVQEGKGEEVTLPGFEDHTPEQLLFLSYAVSWCEYLPESELDIYEEDVHFPPELRVQGPVINSEEFAEIYKCPKGSPMNPDKEKCRLW